MCLCIVTLCARCSGLGLRVLMIVVLGMLLCKIAPEAPVAGMRRLSWSRA